MALAMRSSSVLGGSQIGTASLTRQVYLYQELFRQRDQEYARLLAETHSLTNTADLAEDELVFAIDRAEFAESQLNRLLDSAPQTYKVHAQRVSEFQKTVRSVEQHLKMDDEDRERQERTAWLISRLRLLRPLCQLSEETCGADADRNLGSLLQQCEEKLLGVSGDGTLDELAAEFSFASPLSAVWTLLSQRQSPEDAAKPEAQDQWLLAARQKSPQKAAAEEDLRLQREIETLTDRNEVLRQELRTEASKRGAVEAEAGGAGDLEAEAAKESDAWQRNTQRLVEETMELQNEVARLQVEIPQLETHAAPVRLQLGCERSMVNAHREEIARCRAAVPALTQELRKVVPADNASRARQATLSLLRRELAEAFAALAALEAPADQIGAGRQQATGSAASPEDFTHLERRLEVAKAVNTGLKQAVEARNGSMQSQAASCALKHLESRNELIAKVAKNSKEIADLKERLRREELQEERIKRQESRPLAPGDKARTSPAQSSRSANSGSSHGGAPVSIVVATVASVASIASPLAAARALPSVVATPVATTMVAMPVAAVVVAGSRTPGGSGGSGTPGGSRTPVATPNPAMPSVPARPVFRAPLAADRLPLSGQHNGLHHASLSPTAQQFVRKPSGSALSPVSAGGSALERRTSPHRMPNFQSSS